MLVATMIPYMPLIVFLLVAEVNEDERESAHRKYEKERESIKDTIAFGRRVQGPPPKVYYPPPSRTFESIKTGLGK